jgi:uncharacterized protein YhjY with autotransporter beta-barrel domain
LEPQYLIPESAKSKVAVCLAAICWGRIGMSSQDRTSLGLKFNFTLLHAIVIGSLSAVAFFATSAAAQNLVLDPGFESPTGCAGGLGNCTGVPSWTLSGSAYVDGFSNGVFAHSGSFAVGLVNNGFATSNNNGMSNSGVASQAIALQKGIYQFSFWYMIPSGLTGTLKASVGGTTVFNSNITNQSYLQSISTVTLPKGSDLIQFGAISLNPGGDLFLDDVSLTLLQLLSTNPAFQFISPNLPANAPTNAISAAAGIDKFISANPSLSSLPGGLQVLSSLSGQPLVNALLQSDGEAATGSQQTTFDAMNLFMGMMLDPFNRGPASGPGAGSNAYATEGDASSYAAEGRAHSGAEREAYAMFTKAPPAVYEPRWSTWVAGFGGSQSTDGNAAVGSGNTTSTVYGTAVGADYRFSPNTVAGFALAGGGTNFSVANSGSGHSDLFQFGAFVKHTIGPAYISAALAYGWQDITTNRIVSVPGTSQLRAQFDANAFSGRLEGGYRFVTPLAGGVGITPYVAAQFTTFDLPAYAEQALAGSSAFALAYGAKDVTDPRTELGIRGDKSYAMTDGILILRSRFAWAHDYDPNRSIAATFQSLPGASFVVNGAAQASDSALVTASVEKKWLNGWSAAATFEGEFSDVTRSYAGKGVVRYTW